MLPFFQLSAYSALKKAEKSLQVPVGSPLFRISACLSPGPRTVLFIERGPLQAKDAKKQCRVLYIVSLLNLIGELSVYKNC